MRCMNNETLSGTPFKSAIPSLFSFLFFSPITTPALGIFSRNLNVFIRSGLCIAQPWRDYFWPESGSTLLGRLVAWALVRVFPLHISCCESIFHLIICFWITGACRCMVAGANPALSFLKRGPPYSRRGVVVCWVQPVPLMQQLS